MSPFFFRKKYWIHFDFNSKVSDLAGFCILKKAGFVLQFVAEC